MASVHDQLLAGWIAKALDMLLEVDDQHDMGFEWRADLEALRARYYNYVELNKKS